MGHKSSEQGPIKIKGFEIILNIVNAGKAVSVLKQKKNGLSCIKKKWYH